MIKSMLKHFGYWKWEEAVDRINAIEKSLETTNSSKRPPKNTECNKMVNLWMDTCEMFVPYTEYSDRVPKKERKNELGRMFGCKITLMR